MIGILVRIVSLDYGKVAFIGLFLCGIYYLLYFQDTMNTYESKLSRLKATLNQEQEKEKDTKTTESKAEMVKQNVKDLNSNLEAVQKTLPSNITTSDVIQFVESFSRDAQVQIREKVPLQTVKEDITERLPVKIAFTTSYQRLGKFFVSAANNDRITTIPKYSIRRSQSPDDGALDVEMEINGYRAFESKEESLKEAK